MKRLMLVSALALAGCYTKETPQPEGLSSFDVQIKGLYTTTTPRRSLPVVNACAREHGSQDAVPAEVRGTDACRYAIPLGATDIDLEITAVDAQGRVMESFNGPVSFRVVPGNLTGAYN